MIEELKAFELCPLDGRYSDIKDLVSNYYSEYAYVKYRVFVEIKWLLHLIENKIITFNGDKTLILDIYEKFDINSYLDVKKEEKITNHDVKAIEYFIDNKLNKLGYRELISFVHIGLTSEDINNTAYALMLKDFLNNVYLIKLKEFLDYLEVLSQEYKDISFLAHTHGQPATPTTIGKEFKVYLYRLKNEYLKLKESEVKAKFNGATGNYSALSVAYSNLDVVNLSKNFIKSLNLTFNPLTTQIENHDYLVSILDIIRHINNIILDLDIDMWLYISKSYFKLEVIKNEVGSSTMPHKVNPINFENSEANMEIGNGILTTLSNKLPRSRMQRDLSDSSCLRNLGMAFGYSLQGIKETLKGLKKVLVNELVIKRELENEWEVLAEPIQTVLRKYQIPDAYQRLKDLTRGKSITKEILHEFINTLNISDSDKEILLNLTPETYIGLASKL